MFCHKSAKRVTLFPSSLTLVREGARVPFSKIAIQHPRVQNIYPQEDAANVNDA